MTLKEHEKWKRHWLNNAKLAVKARDWMLASEYYRSAAFHGMVVKHLKEHKRGK